MTSNTKTGYRLNAAQLGFCLILNTKVKAGLARPILIETYYFIIVLTNYSCYRGSDQKLAY